MPRMAISTLKFGDGSSPRMKPHVRGSSISGALLALIIVLDQFPRNMFRGSARAFATDAQAVSLTKEGIEKGFDRPFTGAELDFFTMPLLHSESVDDQALLLATGYGGHRYAREHYETI